MAEFSEYFVACCSLLSINMHVSVSEIRQRGARTCVISARHVCVHASVRNYCVSILILSGEGHHVSLTTILAERPDIGLPQNSPNRPVLCHPQTSLSRDFNHIVAPSCRRPTDTASQTILKKTALVICPTAGQRIKVYCN